MFAEIITGVVGSLVKKGGAHGVKKLFSESPARKAIATTSRRLPDLIVDHALGIWCQSDEFAELLESMVLGRIDPLDDTLVQSFIEVGGFYNGDAAATETSARHVLEVFTGELRSELHKAEGGLAVHAREQRNQHEETRHEIRRATQELSSKISSLLQSVSGRPSPSAPNMPGTEPATRAPLPSMNPSDPPPFHRLDAMSFQELCRDIFADEGGISTCEVYGVSGQSQRGVDLKAQVQEGYGCEVGQCKCYEDFPPAKIREASEEFLTHLDFWREKNVRRFILFVASPLDRRQ